MSKLLRKIQNKSNHKNGVKTIILRVLLQASFLLHSSKEKVL